MRKTRHSVTSWYLVNSLVFLTNVKSFEASLFLGYGATDREEIEDWPKLTKTLGNSVLIIGNT